MAYGGALAFGRLAARFGLYRSILWGTYAWMVIVVLAMFLPVGNVALFLALGVAIAIVLGRTQALSRSFFSLLIPRGREGEYFALYNACERGGMSWFGTLLFGVVFQVTGEYWPAIVALVVFFVLGAVFLLRLDASRGIRAEAGTPCLPWSRRGRPGAAPMLDCVSVARQRGAEKGLGYPRYASSHPPLHVFLAALLPADANKNRCDQNNRGPPCPGAQTGESCQGRFRCAD